MRYRFSHQQQKTPRYGAGELQARRQQQGGTWRLAASPVDDRGFSFSFPFKGETACRGHLKRVAKAEAGELQRSVSTLVVDTVHHATCLDQRRIPGCGRGR